MKGRRFYTVNVLTIFVMLLSLFFSSTVFGEGNNGTDITNKIAKQGQELLMKERQQTAAKLKEELGYGDVDNGQLQAYQPNEQVRVIVEIEQPKAVQKAGKVDQKQQIKKVQDQVIRSIQKTRLKSDVRHRFSEGVQGFSMDTPFKEVERIKELDLVKDVHIAKTFKPALNASKDLVQAKETWENYGLKGEGLLVAVVDSGLDYTHEDMKLSAQGKEAAKWSESSIQSKLDETEVDDVWLSDKVPSGYDWADMDSNVIPKSDTHGMHVAGIVGANGEEADGGVVGVAPDVQLLAEKVFSDESGFAYEDDIIAGIEHAVQLEADVINLSLGTDSGFVGEENDPIQKSIREATEQGTLVVAAAGNAYYSTKNSILETAQLPYASNPDIGIVGEPGVSPYALSVASYENEQIRYGNLKLSNDIELPYFDQTYFGFVLHQVLDVGTSYELVYGGEGTDSDLKDVDAEGKVVIVHPSLPYASYNYAQFAAERKGAIALIVVPNKEIDDFPMLNLSPYSLSTVSTGKSVGLQVIEALENGEQLTLQVADGVWMDNPHQDELSDFSSIGAPHTLDFKPEISAPGGSIFSTSADNDYEVMSGTSMASPHVAGGAALVLQSLYEKGLDQAETSALQAKIALMNTSKIIHQPGTDIPYSPRKQGAGLMQIEHAIETPILVTDKNTALEQGGAVALKEIKGNTAQFLLDIEPLTDEKIEYDVYVDVLTDETETKEFDVNGDGKIDESREYLTLNSKRVEGATVLVNGSLATHEKSAKVLVSPQNGVKLYVNIFLPKSVQDNSFVEGYVRLVPKNPEQSPELTVPYMGFKGKWDTQPNIDPAPWEDDKFLGFTVLWDDMTELPLGLNMETGKFDIEKIAISTLSSAPGVFSTFTAMRNMNKTEMYIEKENGQKLTELGDFSEFTGEPWKFAKNILPFQDKFYEGYLWEVADDEGHYIPDGDYQYVIESTLAFDGAAPQTTKMPIKVDSVAPAVENIQVQPKADGYEISFQAEDNENGSGYYGALLYIDGEYTPLEAGATSYMVDEEPVSVIVMAQDYAYNTSIEIWGDPSYADPYLLVSWFTAYNRDAVNENNPLEIVGYALNRIDWIVIIEDSEGNEVDRFQEERQHTLVTDWTPSADIPAGEYTVHATVTNSDGFEISTEKVSFQIVKENQ
ncbi:S8 family serine peptidase [Ornithinibacillus gellani]|uniref:S8 family serine peptidase n=1 Tax=Ornithinibacillus gellani TaxID=2293253 RepID=UPI001CC21C30|nr:S8 family serine peptidase [Ornithinibacillus gellani]